MTENRRSKRAIRSRMAQTGEKYTAARRARLSAENPDGDTDRVKRRRPVADAYLVELGAHQDSWDAEHAAADLAAMDAAPEELRDLYVVRAAAQPVLGVVIKLSAAGFPGTDLTTDAGWAAIIAVTRRHVLTLRRARIDAGLAEVNLGLIDLVESRLGLWPETEWTTAVREQVQGLVDAKDRGHQRGQQLGTQPAPVAQSNLGTREWMLRHPTDHYFRKARAQVADPALLACLGQQIAACAPSYAALSARDWRSESEAELIVELEISEPVPPGWRIPVPATVVGVHRGDLLIASEVGLRLVADLNAPFNGTMLAVLGGERWLVCGTQLDDATVLPSDGTRRLLTR